MLKKIVQNVFSKSSIKKKRVWSILVILLIKLLILRKVVWINGKTSKLDWIRNTIHNMRDTVYVWPLNICDIFNINLVQCIEFFRKRLVSFSTNAFPEHIEIMVHLQFDQGWILSTFWELSYVKSCANIIWFIWKRSQDLYWKGRN